MRKDVKRVAIYIRVSTYEQAQEGYSIDEQKERLVQYCKAMGWVVSEIYIDPGFSGSNLERPGLQKLIAEIKAYDSVLVYKLDRISRSQKDTDPMKRLHCGITKAVWSAQVKKRLL